MKRKLLLCLTVALILSTAQRAPAPIVEESPKPSATAKPRPKTPAESKPKPRPTVKPEPVSYTGIWETNFHNELILSQAGNHVTGNYDGGRGVIDGTLTGEILSGTFAWRNQTGIFRFSLSKDGKSFTGTFNGSNGQGGPWTGVRK